MTSNKKEEETLEDKFNLMISNNETKSNVFSIKIKNFIVLW